MDKLKNTMLFFKAKSCCPQTKVETHECKHKKGEQAADQKNCCKDETDYVQTDIEAQYDSSELRLSSDLDWIILARSIFLKVNLFSKRTFFSKSFLLYSSYDPPPKAAFHILFCNFRC